MSLASRRFNAICLVALMLVMATPRAHALTYLVGTGAVPTVCDFNSLQLAVNAAAANPGPDSIRVSRESTLTGAALSIGQQDLTITGGYANCTAALPADAQPTGSTILDGAGGALAPVISITGSGVRDLRNLQIRNGDNLPAASFGCGGGIRFAGRGELRLQNIGMSQNLANSGGGICLEADAAPTLLSIEGDVVINNNTATTSNGGGIWISGPARLNMLRDRTLVSANRAPNGDGGGVYFRWPAEGDIGSPGFGNLGVIYANEAKRGGGVASVAADGSEGPGSCVRLFTTASDRPVRLQENRASLVGGGLFMTPNRDGFPGVGSAPVAAQAYDFRIDGNTAPNGAAILLDNDGETGSVLLLNRRNVFSGACDDLPLPPSRVSCTVASACNRIDGNQTRDLNGSLTVGTVINVDGGVLGARYVTVIGNIATRLINASGDSPVVELERTALVGNVVSQEIFGGFGPIQFEMRDTTIAGNSIGAAHVLRFDNADSITKLINVLIDQPSRLTLSGPNINNAGANVHQWIYATDVTTLRPGPTVQTLRGSGRFTDPERGDYRLRIGSEAVDYAPTPVGDPFNGFDLDVSDLDGRLRNVDLGDVSANIRIRDLGPYERQANDPWLQNGEFTFDLRLWFNPNTAHSTWQSAGAPFSSGGALSFSVPVAEVGPTERRLALSQCFNVPSAGLYEIIGAALTPGNNTQTRDFPVINWRVRDNSGDCSGPITASGDNFFLRNNLTWQSLAAPLLITISPAQWTWNTTIEIRLEVAQNTSSPTATGLSAQFDSIIISKRITDLIFANGFD